MSNMPRKYIPGGGINPVYDAMMQDKYEIQHAVEMAKALAPYNNSCTCCNNNYSDDYDDCYDDYCSYNITNNIDKIVIKDGSYEEKLAFVLKHKDNPEEYELAKKIVGIHD